jgi:tRNA (cmo5U34)-methyltransferase
MVGAPMSSQFHFDPATYLSLIHEDIARYDELQDETASATAGVAATAILDLGTGTGETARRVLERHPGARLVGIDENPGMLAVAHEALPDADLRVLRLEDPLPEGPFELVFSALAVHHLDADGKRDLFRRVAAVLAPGGRFVLADVIVPEDPAEASIPLSEGYDTPDTLADQLEGLAAAGFDARPVWVAGDLAIVRADLAG